MSKLRINLREMHGITILDLTGDLAGGHGARKLASYLQKANFPASAHVLLNFTAVRSLDEACLDVIADCWQHRVRTDNHLKVFGIDKRPGKMAIGLLTLTKLVTAFDVFDNEHLAIASYDRQDYDLMKSSRIVRNQKGTVAEADIRAMDALRNQRGHGIFKYQTNLNFPPR
jgi:anti-sigma B factor antagonist